MGQFKPMVKMMTTEPSVELKLKKGGHVKKPVKKQMGGVMGGLDASPAVRRPVAPVAAAAPARPSLAARRRAMMGRRGMAAPVMAKKDGEMESKAEHAKEMREMKGMEKKLEKHKSMPASKAHKGLKTGGVVKGQGGYKTGGVVKGQGGYKKGGAVKKPVDSGSMNDSGHAVDMPQGRKKPSSPVSINRLSGTFKKGGSVKKYNQGGSAPKMVSVEKEKFTTNVDDSMPTPEEMKRLRETYDRQLKNEQKGSENFMKNLRLRKKGGCA